MTGWGEGLADWWLSEVATDIGYSGEVLPLALDLLRPEADEVILDIGCGEGRVMREIAERGARPHGCDLSHDLLKRATSVGPVVRCELPSLKWSPDGAFDAAVMVLVLEHLPSADEMLAEAYRVVRPGGTFVLVVNHPVLTAPDSGPIVDPDDDEVLWRWGDYFGFGATHEPAGDSRITFHHRSMGALLTAAAEAGWCLDALVEAPVGEQRRNADPFLAAQGDVPRLLGVRWQRR